MNERLEPLVTPLLAQINLNSQNLWVYFLLFMFVGMPILRALFGQKKPSAKRPQQRRRPVTQGRPAPRSGPSAGPARPAAGGAASGGGLTMAERIARARQAQQGGAGPSPTTAQRPAPVRASTAASPSSRTRTTPQARPAGSASSQRGPAAAAAADRQARAQQAARQRQQKQREALARRQREQVQAQQRRQQQLMQQRQRQAAQKQADHYQEEHATHRLVSDAIDDGAMAAGEIGATATDSGAGKRRRGGARAVLNGNNLREAFILKEVLDRPLTLRDEPGR